MDLMSLFKTRDPLLDRKEAIREAVEDFVYIMKWGLSSNRAIQDLSTAYYKRFLLWQKWFFEENAKKGILYKVHDEYTKGITKMKRPERVDDLDWTLIDNLTLDWTSKVRNDKELDKIWLEGLIQGYNAGGRAFLSRLGIRRPSTAQMQKGIRVGASFNLREPAIVDLLKNRVNLLRPAVDDFTFKQIKATVLDSYYYKGEHPYETARRLRGTFTETYRNRARTIARTETNWAMSEANIESMKRAEVPFKKWLATKGACEECEPLNKEITEVGRPFSNGWNSPADAHPNCRCAVAPKMRKGQKPSRYWDGESLNLIEDVPRVPGIPQLGRLPGQVVSFNTSPYTAIPKGDLIGKTTLQMREMSKARGIKYFRVMNKDELITVLANPSKAAEIGQIARARWMKTGIKPPTPTSTRITDLAAGYEKKSTAELMRIAQSKHIPNFRVMRKKELITVLSDPSKYDDIQLAVKTRLRVARGKPGKSPGTTMADDLGLTDIEARKTRAIDTIAERSISLDENRSTESFRSRVKKWLKEYDIEVLEAGAKRNLTFELYKTERDVRWRSGSRNFSGIYCRNKIGLVRWNFGYRPSTFNHEMGHFIQDSVPSYRKVAIVNNQALIEERTKTWIPQAHRFDPWQEKWQYIVDGGDKIVSKYAMHSGSEHFAEAIKSYMDPNKNVGLQAVAPKLYNRIKIDVFKGKEFYAK